jgi:hypothetical protein
MLLLTCIENSSLVIVLLAGYWSVVAEPYRESMYSVLSVLPQDGTVHYRSRSPICPSSDVPSYHLDYPAEKRKALASLPESPWVMKTTTPYEESASHSLLLVPLGVVEPCSSLVAELHPFPIGWVD